MILGTDLREAIGALTALTANKITNKKDTAGYFDFSNIIGNEILLVIAMSCIK